MKKVKVKLIEVFRFLKEAKCPFCGDPNAYVGMNKVDCPTCGGDAKTKKKYGAAPPTPAAAGHGQSPASTGAGGGAGGLGTGWQTSLGQKRYDKFSKTPQEYVKNVGDVLDRLIGKSWKSDIDGGYGKGTVDRLFKELWDGNWSDYEGVEELGFYWDNVARGDVHQYRARIDPRQDWDDYANDYVDRPKRPMDPSDFK